MPIFAILSLPILFAAGMSLMDTLDGAFMNLAYGWAFSNPSARSTTTSRSRACRSSVALAIGTIELLQVLSAGSALSGGFWDWLQNLDFETLGYAVVALFVVMWAMSVSIWKLRRIEDRWAAVVADEHRPG